ncbi:major facilitator superfamily domain-containing protein [Baffinella frigidus]|nr:major facilitator superfamily domain-containing protein [Cryptophyta sp. CCMP2293]
MTAWEILKEPGFLSFCVVLFVFAGCLWIPMTFIANYATKDAGLSANDAAALVSYTGVASTTGRVAFGRLSKWIPQLVLLQGSVLVSGLAILLLGVAPPSYFVLALHAILFGFFSGSTIALLAPIIIGLVGLRNLPVAFGIAACVQAPGVLIAPPLGGALRDATGVMTWTFIVPGAMMVLSSALVWAIPAPRHS